MLKQIAAAATLLALAGCTTAEQGDAAGCAAALLGAGTSSPASLATIAATTPACIALGSDAIQTIVNQVSAKQMARGVPQR